jgi:two-component system CheB/CheR fusion protein
MNDLPDLPSRDTKLKVLLIDDSVDACIALRELLRVADHEVETAYDGETGIATALRFRPDVVVLDITLPDMNGFEVASRLQALEKLAATRLIACSGRPGEGTRRRAERAGFHHYLLKPVRLTDLRPLLLRGR